MLGNSPPGLTARDFHPPSFINPRDIFPNRSRERFRPGSKPTQENHSQISLPTLPLVDSHSRLLCCGKDAKLKSAPCVNLGTDDILDAPSPGSCEGDCDKCEDCFEDHKECDEDAIQCVDDCDECLDEHEKACGQHGQVCTETCDDCDFSCFDCVDWQAFEKDKDLGLSFSVPLLNQGSVAGLDPFQDVMDTTFQSVSTETPASLDLPAAPVNLFMHHQCLQNYTPFWNGMPQSQLCPDLGDLTNLHITDENPAMISPFMTAPYGCHPAAVHQTTITQQSLPLYDANLAIQQSLSPTAKPSQQASITPQTPILASPLSSGRVCHWLMPCGNTCGASFASASDLRKHLKADHCVKGMVKCSWANCTASFATEAALTGHISKKHLSNAITEEDGPFKCTFPGCPKSFMYKQVRDDHVTSHSGGNKMYCHICGQFLNSEGSNFRRHMASHQPKHQHVMCKYHHLGCKKRFPRLDNLRRHEAVCRVGKKAALHHHHYHRHVGHS